MGVFVQSMVIELALLPIIVLVVAVTKVPSEAKVTLQA